jgi:predicted transposase/invertase (TIGR01784 family)
VEFSDIQEVHILELPKAPAENDGTPLWLWLRFLAATRKEEFMAIAEQDPVLNDGRGQLRVMNEEDSVRVMAFLREKAIRDEISYRMDILNECREKGMGKGMEKGVEMGLEIGRLKGREEGREKREAEIIRTAMRKGRSPAEIADFTGIPLERVEELAGGA